MSIEEDLRKFSEMPLSERIALVDERTGNIDGRIKTPDELAEMKGETVHIIVSPAGHSGREHLGNAYYYTWVVDEVVNVFGHDGTPDDIRMYPKHGPFNQYFEEKDNTSIWVMTTHVGPCSQFVPGTDGLEVPEGKHYLSLRDVNIIPNCYNDHAVFVSEDNAREYQTFLRLQFPVDKPRELLEGKIPLYLGQESIDKFTVQLEKRIRELRESEKSDN